MKEIELTRGMVTLVDEEIFDSLDRFNWYARPCNGGNIFYASRKRLQHETGKSWHIHMHRVVANCPDGMFVDHIDGNKLNNQKHNLRICSYAENGKNRIINMKRSLPKGVSIKKGRTINKFVAQIGSGYEKIHIGYFPTPEAAAAAYDEMAIKLHGKFALTNNKITG